MLRVRAMLMFCALGAGYAPVFAQDSAGINAKIRKEAADNSQIMPRCIF